MGKHTRSVETKYGQITPPEDDAKPNWPSENADGAQIDPIVAPDQVRHNSPDSSSSSIPPTSTTASTAKSKRGGVDKKDKYREKNRVAAAKCRAKKKEHTDGLEETHRTQGMLNSLLKQTEQNLRDELSFWRTQALQHAYCGCTPIQEYNLRKAKALATDKDFGGAHEQQQPSSSRLPVGDDAPMDDSFFTLANSNSTF